jgi:hypothetical protein
VGISGNTLATNYKFDNVINSNAVGLPSSAFRFMNNVTRKLYTFNAFTLYCDLDEPNMKINNTAAKTTVLDLHNTDSIFSSSPRSQLVPLKHTPRTAHIISTHQFQYETERSNGRNDSGGKNVQSEWIYKPVTDAHTGSALPSRITKNALLFPLAAPWKSGALVRFASLLKDLSDINTST